MAYIAKHNTEQKWERDNRKYCRIDFFMHRYTIGIDDLLEDVNEFIRSDKSGWLDFMIFKTLKVSRAELQHVSTDHFLSVLRAPEITYVGALSKSRQIQTAIDGLFFSNEPFVNFEAAWASLID
jgi:hypothetical protein